MLQNLAALKELNLIALKGPVQDRSFAGVHAIKTKTNAGKGFMYATSKVLNCVAYAMGSYKYISGP